MNHCFVVTWETYLCFKANCRSFIESLLDSLEQEERTIENLMMASQMHSFVDLVQLYRMFKHPFVETSGSAFDVFDLLIRKRHFKTSAFELPQKHLRHHQNLFLF